AALTCARLGLAPQPDEGPELAGDPVCILQAGDSSGQLLLCSLRRIRFQDPGVPLHDLTERPEAHTVSIGKRAALPPPDQLRIRVDPRKELVDEAALADAGLPDQRYELRGLLVPDAIERVTEDGRLAPAADQRSAGAADVDLEPGARLERPPDGDRLGLPLRV